MESKDIWKPVVYSVDDHRAVQVLADYARLADVAWNPDVMGPPPPAPSPLDVKRALDCIILKLAQTYESSFLPDDPNGRIGAFVEGRRSVGQAVVKLMKLKVGTPQKVIDDRS